MWQVDIVQWLMQEAQPHFQVHAKEDQYEALVMLLFLTGVLIKYC